VSRRSRSRQRNSQFDRSAQFSCASALRRGGDARLPARRPLPLAAGAAARGLQARRRKRFIVRSREPRLMSTANGVVIAASYRLTRSRSFRGGEGMSAPSTRSRVRRHYGATARVSRNCSPRRATPRAAIKKTDCRREVAKFAPTAIASRAWRSRRGSSPVPVRRRWLARHGYMEHQQQDSRSGGRRRRGNYRGPIHRKGGVEATYEAELHGTPASSRWRSTLGRGIHAVAHRSQAA